ncbi:MULTISPECIES: PTS sugar transporter subunit IIB [unclassified Breznakia]|uniref:PTS sugar transporter subunit IIB n=1 Tax=unclassified Breznakia TaxID=2623764 RepID=UPI002475866E|nr:MULTISPECIES: PTS sugar transporter subunit IIB [unclassified Breznakia]MDH6367219.1 PTS system cellobiose-specific IIB component [Breznakia sp. PH1-1]MDH6404361.1 PTS system cellobiose-specific IIB component [Breznakia sp. PF1-11]MDH6412070.1 PTS system cellobiose-specific IIB component [Breznakia sp. PFB1-11]MDH6414349.1 PTS system cellobiose-specific IIB component [Breznakia sp. PFB1-14]MDH6416721.1 PTS system cellobiose-specific IIB component [Breznakia sp. PFB1-4]
MKQIVLLCSAGLSTSMLVEKMKEAANEKGLKYQIAAYSMNQLESVKDEADIILLGPQVRFQLDQVKQKVDCPVQVIDMIDYGQMNGSKVVDDVNQLIG